MTRTLIYVIAAFALWLFFKFAPNNSFSGGREEGGGGRDSFMQTPQTGGQTAQFASNRANPLIQYKSGVKV